jgi:hypothetical protein
MAKAMLQVYEEVLSAAYEPAAVEEFEPVVGSFSN